jgi:hypothetical protein
LAPGPIPVDLANRLDLVREFVPAYLLQGAVVNVVDAPEVPTAAVLDSAVQNFVLTGGGTFDFVVDEYTGVKVDAGEAATLESGRDPATACLSTADRVQISIAGEAAQTVELGAQTTGAGIAASFQAVVRALTPALAVNLKAYTAFLAEYVPQTFVGALAVAIANTEVVEFITLEEIAPLRKGQNLKINGAIPQTVEIIDIDYARNRLRVSRFTAAQAYAAAAVVDTADDYYKLTTGKYGSDMSILVSDGLTENAAINLKLKAAQGASAVVGVNNLGAQKVLFVNADFAVPAAATAAEVVVVVNRALTGVIASVSAGKVRLTSRTLGLDGRVRALPGAAVTLLGYSETEQVGVETEVLLGLDEATITCIQPYVIGGALLDPIVGADIAATVSVRRRRVRNVSGVDQSNGGLNAWIVTSKPSAD